MNYKIDYEYHDNGTIAYINIFTCDKYYNKNYETTRFSKSGKFKVVTYGEFRNKGYGYGDWRIVSIKRYFKNISFEEIEGYRYRIFDDDFLNDKVEEFRGNFFIKSIYI